MGFLGVLHLLSLWSKLDSVVLDLIGRQLRVNGLHFIVAN